MPQFLHLKIILLATFSWSFVARSDIPQTQEGYTELRSFSAEERAATCKRYTGRYLANADRIYFIEGCALREVVDQNLIESLVAKGVALTFVENEVIAQFESGAGLNLYDKQKSRLCQSLHDRYLSFDFETYFIAEHCVLKQFPDMETFYDHRRRLGRLRDEVVQISLKELRGFTKREWIPTVLKADMVKLYPQTQDVEIIDRDKACEGLNNKDVSFVVGIYRIENCRKRAYDAATFNWKFPNARLTEISAEQWISLPDGPPMD